MPISEMPDDEKFDDIQDLAPDLVEVEVDEETEEVIESESKEEVEDEDTDLEAEESVGEEEDKVKAKVADDDHEPGDEDYGKKVKKRINKLVFEKNSEHDKRETAEARVAELEQQIAESAASDAENTRKTTLETSSRERDDLVKSLNEAYEEGDAEEISNVTAKLSRKDAEIVAMENAKPVPRETQDKPAGNSDLPQYAKSAAKWLDDNSWYGDQKHKKIAVLAETIEDTLRSDEGYDLGDDLYKELDRRLLLAVPRLADIKGVDEDDLDEEIETKTKPKKPRSIVSGQDSGDAVIPVKPKAGKLTKGDLEKMSRYGFDPNSSSDRKNWLNRNAQL